MWRLYGWFSGLMAFGSCVGIVTWVSKMQQLASNVQGSAIFAQQRNISAHLYFAAAANWQAGFAATYAVEFLCLTAAQLMVLDRMSDFAMPGGQVTDDDKKRWSLWERIVLAAVVIISIVGVCGNVAAVPNWLRAASYSLSAYSSFSKNNWKEGYEFVSAAKQYYDDGFDIASVQMFCEVAVLLLIICIFAVVGVYCLRRVRAIMSNAASHSPAFSAEGNHLRKQIYFTTVVVFVTFLIRSVQSTMQALAFALSNVDAKCPNGDMGLCNPVCYNTWTHMLRWMQRTPEFQVIIVVISSPFALVVALWGMTSPSALKLMREPEAAPLAVRLIPRNERAGTDA